MRPSRFAPSWEHCPARCRMFARASSGLVPYSIDNHLPRRMLHQTAPRGAPLGPVLRSSLAGRERRTENVTDYGDGRCRGIRQFLQEQFFCGRLARGLDGFCPTPYRLNRGRWFRRKPRRSRETRDPRRPLPIDQLPPEPSGAYGTIREEWPFRSGRARSSRECGCRR